jgi:hypothetical protein
MNQPFPPGGMPQGAHPQHQTAPQLEVMGVISFIIGIVCLPTNCCCGLLSFPLNAVGIVLGILSLNKIGRDLQLWKGKAFAVLGVVLSTLMLIVIALMLAGAVGVGGLEQFMQHMKLQQLQQMKP